MGHIRGRMGPILGVALLALVYWAAATLGLSQELPGTNATAVWAPTGVSLAALFLFGLRLWPGVALGAFLANVGTDVPIASVVGITAGNTLEALAGTWMLRRARFRPAIDRMRDVAALAILAASASTLISAAIGVTSVRLGGAISTDAMPHVFRVWWLGDMTGDLVVGATIMVFWTRPRSPRTAMEWIEAAAVLASLAAVAEFAINTQEPRAFLVYPWAIYAAVRFRQLGAVAVSAVVFAIATWYVVHGQGIFAQPDTPNGLVLSQAFVGVTTLVTLTLAAVITERGAAREEALAAVERVSRLHALSAALAGATSAADVASIMAEQGVAAAGGNGGWVALRNDRRGVLELIGQAGFAAEEVERSREVRLDADMPALAGIRHDRPVWSGPHGSRATASERDSGPPYGTSLDVSLAAMPLRFAGRPSGLYVVSFDAEMAFDEAAKERLLAIAALGGQALERANLFEHEHEVAVALQRSLLPAHLPTLHALDLAATYLPASVGVEVGGDWYDAFELSDGRVLLAVGDVVGHGLEAAKAMGQVRSALRAYAVEDPMPSDVLERLNRVTGRLERGALTTLVVGLVDTSRRRLTLANAGHPPPLLVAPDGSRRLLDDDRGFPLGVRTSARHVDLTFEFGPGAAVILYTDGLVERRDASIDEGIDRLAAIAAEGIADAAPLCDRLIAELVPDGPRKDDIAVLVCRATTVPTGHLRLDLPARPDSLVKVRRAIETLLAGTAVGEDELLQIQVACGEACSNAIEHAYGPADAHFELTAAVRDDMIEIRVRDYGAWRHPRGRYRGHGRMLMQGCMDQVEVIRHQQGTEVLLNRRLSSNGLR